MKIGALQESPGYEPVDIEPADDGECCVLHMKKGLFPVFFQELLQRAALPADTHCYIPQVQGTIYVVHVLLQGIGVALG